MVSGVSSGASRADLAQQMQAMREAMFQKADTDGSGGLSLSEFAFAGPSAGTAGSAASAADAAGTQASTAPLPPPPDPPPGVSSSGGSGSSTGAAMSSDTFATLLSAQEDDGTGATAAGTTGNTTGRTAADLFGSLDTDGDGSLSETGLEAGLASAPPPPPPGAEGGLGPMLSAQEDASSSDASQQNIRDLARQFIAAIRNALDLQSATSAATA